VLTGEGVAQFVDVGDDQDADEVVLNGVAGFDEVLTARIQTTTPRSRNGRFPTIRQRS
jgi:hypothetical protein